MRFSRVAAGIHEEEMTIITVWELLNVGSVESLIKKKKPFIES